LKKVVVTPFYKTVFQEEELIRSIARSAAKVLEEMIPHYRTIGIGWGKTVYQTISDICSPRKKKNGIAEKLADTTFIPLIGSLGQSLSCYQVNSMIVRLSEYYKANGRFLNLPAYITDGTAEQIESLEYYQMIKALWDTVDLAIVGLGGPVQNSEIIHSGIEKQIINKLLLSETIGDILGRFFDLGGDICQSGLETRLIGLDLESLCKIDTVVCICGGVQKVYAIRTALKKRYFNCLITDQMTAVSLQE
jgi:DNA-binding transcriptional regulator LsrR (DeoR family)